MVTPSLNSATMIRASIDSTMKFGFDKISIRICGRMLHFLVCRPTFTGGKIGITSFAFQAWFKQGSGRLGGGQLARLGGGQLARFGGGQLARLGGGQLARLGGGQLARLGGR